MRSELPQGIRTHKFYVLETKSFAHGLKITDEGEFLRWNDWKKTYEGMPSPVEQNRRHAEILRDVLERLGYVKPEIESFVLISPTARVDRSKKHLCPEVVKSDQFTTAFTKRFLDSVSTVGGVLSGLSKALFGDSAEAIAKKLVALHKPIAIDYDAKFGFGGVAAEAGIRPQPSLVELAPVRETETLVDVEKVARELGPDAPSCKSCGNNQLLDKAEFKGRARLLCDTSYTRLVGR